FPASEGENALRVEFFGDEIDRISEINALTGAVLRRLSYAAIYPASHYAISDDKRLRALDQIKDEMEERVEFFEAQGKLLEAQRIRTRTEYDLEMISEVGYCSGVENYSRVFAGRAPGSTPYCLLDYFPKDYLLFVDESHATLPQVRGMSAGDRARKQNLVDYGFRLPSAYDNRPLVFEEFEQKINQAIFVSATPGEYERQHSASISEQLIRPTGLTDPEIEIRPVEGQVDDLLGEIRQRTERGERVLVTTLTTKMAEDLTEYIQSHGIKVQYIHHEVETMQRTEILRDLRLGVYDVLVGINLLREGLDLPEVSLVAILDADKEGLLRSEVSLIQTIGRAARHENGKVIMYADTVTGSMRRAIEETDRRRTIQKKYNEEHGITPHTVVKAVRDVIEIAERDDTKNRRKRTDHGEKKLSDGDRGRLIDELTAKMRQAAKELRFEEAAAYRDRIRNLSK
ncbi:MAG: UvrB/UvrC motif-containing protein, partial [Clostridia bacterium]|nr:UvrB/UvrC motif-containing protein [Clostridia bacterium]